MIVDEPIFLIKMTAIKYEKIFYFQKMTNNIAQFSAH
jgi:hypothetical protein